MHLARRSGVSLFFFSFFFSRNHAERETYGVALAANTSEVQKVK